MYLPEVEIMAKIELNLKESQIDFLQKHNFYGFADESELVTTALIVLQNQLNEQNLIAEQKEQTNNDDHPDPFLNGLFSGSPTLSIEAEEILSKEINNKSGWTWK